MSTTATTTKICLTDGQEVDVASNVADTFRGLDADGHQVIVGWENPDGSEYLVGLTLCCQATATGTEHGIACRACYSPCEQHLGGEASVAIGVAS